MTAGLVYGSLATGVAIGLLIAALFRSGDRSDLAEAHLHLFHRACNVHHAWQERVSVELHNGDVLAADVDLAEHMDRLGDTLAHVDAVSRA
mgnify:CR=1 FL=1